MSISNLFLSIGKPIKNEYGKIVGKVASFALTPNGKFDAVYIEFGDGQFAKHPMESLRFNGADITFITKIKSQAASFCDQIPLIWQRCGPKISTGQQENSSRNLPRLTHQF